MQKIKKSVFLSYRRTNIAWALAIFQNLTEHGFDVFFDFTGIASGDFERVILKSIKARAHFLVLLTPSALERCHDPNDWLRREIEAAFAARRNVVPLMLEGFDFSTPGIGEQLKGTLEPLRHYNALQVPAAFFAEAMDRLRDKFLNIPLNAVLHPTSLFAEQSVRDQQVAAGSAPSVQQKELSAQEWFEQGARAESLKDDSLAANYYRRAADVGNIDAMAKLGLIYATGRGVPQDDAQAVIWYSKAADDGNALAMSGLGHMYFGWQGGLPRDDVQAAKWYRKAADAGNANAMANLGLMYANGRGVPQDDAQAVSWYRKAADAGDGLGMSGLGYMYRGGRGGLPRDDAQALIWFLKAADVGNADAMANLGLMYANGRGVPQDDAQAVSWYRKGAYDGGGVGMSALGYMYETGRGVPRNDAQAVIWYRKGAEAGNAYAVEALKRLRR